MESFGKNDYLQFTLKEHFLYSLCKLKWDGVTSVLMSTIPTRVHVPLCTLVLASFFCCIFSKRLIATSLTASPLALLPLHLPICGKSAVDLSQVQLAAIRLLHCHLNCSPIWRLAKSAASPNWAHPSFVSSAGEGASDVHHVWWRQGFFLGSILLVH